MGVTDLKLFLERAAMFSVIVIVLLLVVGVIIEDSHTPSKEQSERELTELLLFLDEI